MAKRFVGLPLGLLLPALATAALAAGTAGPVLRSATPQGGHLVVVFSLGDLARAAEIEAATSPRRGVNGAFLAGFVKLREKIAAGPRATTGLVRWRTRNTLPPGRYYVHVSGVDVGETSCKPYGAECLEEWSNLLRVVVPRARR
jgi:hypothetical protein